MSRLDFSFEYWKLNAIGYFKKLQDLDLFRRKLNEQLFLLDMQQEVSIKRYRTYLIQIGEHQQRENTRYFELQHFDESHKYRHVKDFSEKISLKINEIKSLHITHDQITTLAASYKKLNESILKEKETVFNLTKKTELIDNLNSKISIPSNIEEKQLQNIDLHASYQSNSEDISKALLKKRKLLKQQERLIQELKISAKLEKEISHFLFLIQQQASKLVGNSQWRPSINTNSQSLTRNPQFFTSYLSIP